MVKRAVKFGVGAAGNAAARSTCYSARVIRALAPASALIAVVAAILAAACSTSDDGSDEPTVIVDDTVVATAAAVASCEPGFSAAPGDVTGTISSGGVERSYVVHVPSTYNGTKPAPLVVVYHGFASSAQAMADYARFNTLADAEGFVVLYPNGTEVPARWNDDSDVTVADDVQFTEDLVAKVQAELCIDESRVYAVGWSNGGGMAQRVGCELPEVFAGIGTVSATYSDCKSPLPWIAFHGMADPQVPFEGGVNPPERGGGVFLPTRRVLSEYAREQGCDALAQITLPSSEVELSTYVRCPTGDGLVLLYTLLGGGHTWPGSADLPLDLFGPTSKQIDATQAMWDFFVTTSGPPEGENGSSAAD